VARAGRVREDTPGGEEVALWLGSEVLTVEYAGELLARYDVEYSPRTKNLREVKKPQLFETIHRVSVAQLACSEAP
jgi:ribosomal protein S30